MRNRGREREKEKQREGETERRRIGSPLGVKVEANVHPSGQSSPLVVK
jgi:hypothetical protein